MKRIKLVDMTLEDWGVTLKGDMRRRKGFAIFALLFLIGFGILQFAFYYYLRAVFGLAVYTVFWLILLAPLIYWERRAVMKFLKSSPQIGDVINFAFASALGARLSVYDATLVWFQEFVIIVLAYGTVKFLVLSLAKDNLKFLYARGTSHWYEW